MALELDGGSVVYQMRAKEPYYLLLKSATSGFWGFPKGHLENTESALEAAEREIREETGIIATVDDRFYDVLNYRVGENDKKVTLFTAKVPEDTVVRLQKEEISMAAWLDYAAARKRLTYLNLKQALDNADQYIRKAEQ